MNPIKKAVSLVKKGARKIGLIQPHRKARKARKARKGRKGRK